MATHAGLFTYPLKIAIPGGGQGKGEDEEEKE